ncbi:uncharacterized protein PHACADRAFT_55137, partial [Phanerochaete carnosa HHB-10118-sp]
ASPPPKPRKRRKKAEPVVYDIPPITSFKTTAFEGRLGYACLNTVLRAQDPPVFCSRTCRLATLQEKGVAHAQALGLRNVRDLAALVAWNEANGIRFMRLSSEMFPFASHAVWGYDLAYARDDLAAVGALARRLGHRLTAHPGQFTQLASLKEAVVAASIRELEYHCQMMRYMGLGRDSVIVLHMGGVYGDKAATIARFRTTYATRLTDEMRARLVLENDEMCYSADDLLPVCDALAIPLVLDYHHNYINPSALALPDLVRRINGTWARKRIRVKQHLSEPRPGLSSSSSSNSSGRAAAAAPPPHPRGGGDLMIEAKDKEQAVLQLYRLYRLCDVRPESLRPER